MKEMMRRFDEVVSDKASKSALSQLEYEVDQSYVKKKYWDRLQSEITDTMERQQVTMQKMEESVKNFETNMAVVVDTAVKHGLAKYMVNYERVLTQFQKFFDQEELQKIIDSKADLALVQNMRDFKANKSEVEQCLMLIDTVHERLKHLSILQTEMARAMIPQKTPTTYNVDEAINHNIYIGGIAAMGPIIQTPMLIFEKTLNQGLQLAADTLFGSVPRVSFNHKIARREFLFKQAQVTSQWVVDQPLKIEEIVQNNKVDEVIEEFTPDTVNVAPTTVKQFERFHYQVQEHLKVPDAPQLVKRWKNQHLKKNTDNTLMMNRHSKSVSQTGSQSNLAFLQQHKKSMRDSVNASALLKRRSSNNSRRSVSPKDAIQLNELLHQQKEHFKSILRAKNKDFDGAASGMLDTPNIKDTLFYDESQMSSLFYGSDRVAPQTAGNAKRVMIYKNSEPNAFQKVGSKGLGEESTFSNSKVLLNRYNGKVEGNGTRFEAQVIINGGDRSNTNKQQRILLSNKVNNSVVIQSPIQFGNVGGETPQHEMQYLEQAKKKQNGNIIVMSSSAFDEASPNMAGYGR